MTYPCYGAVVAGDEEATMHDEVSAAAADVGAAVDRRDALIVSWHGRTGASAAIAAAAGMHRTQVQRIVATHRARAAGDPDVRTHNVYRRKPDDC